MHILAESSRSLVMEDFICGLRELKDPILGVEYLESVYYALYKASVGVWMCSNTVVSD